MTHFSAPDGSAQPMNSQTLQHLGSVPPFSLAFLDTRTEAAWEQAAVVYINGQRQGRLVGNYHHPTIFWLPQVAHDQQVMLAGWHKRSGPDGGQPWHASRGRRQGEWAEWDDSRGDLDFNDFRVRVVRLPGLHILPFGIQLRAWPESASPSWNTALFLTSLANMRALVPQMPEADAKKALAQQADDIVSRIMSDCRRLDAEREIASPLQRESLEVASHLNAIANLFAEGELRVELKKLAAEMLNAEGYSKKD
jgi:hypothetical protein